LSVDGCRISSKSSSAFFCLSTFSSRWSESFASLGSTFDFRLLTFFGRSLRHSGFAYVPPGRALRYIFFKTPNPGLSKKDAASIPNAILRQTSSDQCRTKFYLSSSFSRNLSTFVFFLPLVGTVRFARVDF